MLFRKVTRDINEDARNRARAMIGGLNDLIAVAVPDVDVATLLDEDPLDQNLGEIKVQCLALVRGVQPTSLVNNRWLM
jgi:hypothetical protein